MRRREDEGSNPRLFYSELNGIVREESCWTYVICSEVYT